MMYEYETTAGEEAVNQAETQRTLDRDYEGPINEPWDRDDTRAEALRRIVNVARSNESGLRSKRLRQFEEGVVAEDSFSRGWAAGYVYAVDEATDEMLTLIVKLEDWIRAEEPKQGQESA